MKIQHLPYEIDENQNRYHYYENYWKIAGLELLKKHCIPEGKTLLDYGCGRGECLKFAAEAGFIAQGTDVDPECVKIASQHGPTSLLEINDPVKQFGRKSFDVITCFHVLEHVENPKQVLSALAEMARSYVVIAVPNLRYLHRLFCRDIQITGFNAGHLQSWDHWHFLNLAERHCGLKLIEWGSDATILPFLSDMTQKLFGSKAAIRLERDFFRKLFPFHGISVLGLFSTNPEDETKIGGTVPPVSER